MRLQGIAGHFPKRRRRAGVPEASLFGLLRALKLSIFLIPSGSAWDLSSGKITVLSDQGCLTTSFSSDFLLKGSVTGIYLEAKALTTAGCVI